MFAKGTEANSNPYQTSRMEKILNMKNKSN